VVTTTGGSLPEVAGDTATLIDPGDEDALADAIAKLATTRPLPPAAWSGRRPSPGNAARS
jgi:hypothetical protein